MLMIPTAERLSEGGASGGLGRAGAVLPGV